MGNIRQKHFVGYQKAHNVTYHSQKVIRKSNKHLDVSGNKKEQIHLGWNEKIKDQMAKSLETPNVEPYLSMSNHEVTKRQYTGLKMRFAIDPIFTREYHLDFCYQDLRF